MIANIITIIYFIIGVVVAYYDWTRYTKFEYETMRQYSETEDGMVSIYFMGIIVFWPIKLYFLLKK